MRPTRSMGRAKTAWDRVNSTIRTAFDNREGAYDTADMSETLTIRVPAGEKARWEKAAAAARETVAEYVRGAVR